MRSKETKADRTRERRETIITAAVAVFLEQGVERATMDGIARKAGLSKGALYLYFQSKDELYLNIALDWLHELVGRAEELEALEHQDGLAAFRVAMQMYVDHAIQHKSRFLVAMSWLNSSYSVDDKSALFAEYKEAIAAIHGFACRAIERAKADGSLAISVDTPRFAMQVWGATLGLILVEQNSEEIARRAPVPVSMKGLGFDFLDLILSGENAISLGPLKTRQERANESQQL